MERAVALLSGGLDSGTSLALWLDRPEHEVLSCLTLDYGQRSAAAEAAAAEALAGRFGLPWTLLELPWLGDAAVRAGCALVTREVDLPETTAASPGDADSAAAVWVPARNLLFLSIAASYAESGGATRVLVGFNREEAATFADNSAAFVAAFDRAAALGTRNGVTACSPTLAMDKAEIVAAARRHGLTAADFWSCYGAGPSPCGRCESCVRSARAWDPVVEN